MIYASCPENPAQPCQPTYHHGHFAQHYKTRERIGPPDRNAQFEYLSTQIQDYQQHRQSTIFVAAKKNFEGLAS
jgi:hypothetical protein